MSSEARSSLYGANRRGWGAAVLRPYAEGIASTWVRYAGGMASQTNAGEVRTAAGLCADCVHARRVESERGSVFVMCQLSATDANFPKYPRLPVLSCAGYLRKDEPRGSEDR